MFSVRSIALAGLLILAAPSAFASMIFDCQGETAKEKLKFVVDGGEGITLTYVSSELCGRYTSIDADEDGAFISEASKQTVKNATTFDLWDGNWGWTISIPKAIAAGESDGSGRKFTMTYHFTYNDIDELELDRKLVCKKQR